MVIQSDHHQILKDNTKNIILDNFAVTTSKRANIDSIVKIMIKIIN